MDASFEYKALYDLAHETFPRKFDSEFRKLGALGTDVWRKSLHDYFTMDEGKLEMIAG